MKLSRGMRMSLCALAVAPLAAMAQESAQGNLRYSVTVAKGMSVFPAK